MSPRLRPRWKKVLRDVLSNKTRTLLVVLSIAVGSCAVGTMLTLQEVLLREMNRNWQAARPASAIISMQGFYPDFVEAVRQMPEVSEAEGRSTAYARARAWRVGDGDKQGKNDDVLLVDKDGDWKSINLVAVNKFDEQRVNLIQKQTAGQGDWPPAKREIILASNTLDFLGIHIGDNVTVKAPSGSKYVLRVAGTAYSVNENGSPFMVVGTGYVSMDTWEWLDQGRAFNSLAIRVSDQLESRAHIQEVADMIRDRARNQGLAFYDAEIQRNPNQHPGVETVQGIVSLMTALGIAALILSGFLVINTVSAVLAQHIRQIGMMKSIGASSGELVPMYLGMVLAFGVLSLFIALPLGVLGAQAFVNYVGETLLNLRIGMAWPSPQVFGLQASIGLLAPLLAALAPILSGTRKTVHQALSDYGLGSGTAKRNANRPPSVIGNWLSRPMRLALRNTFRRKGRLLFTLLTLVLGGGIFMGVMSAREGLTQTLESALRYWNYDVDVSLDTAYPIEQIQREAAAVPGVRQVESWGFGAARRLIGESRTQGFNFTLVAPPADTAMLNPLLLQGRWLNSDDENAIVLNTEALKNMSDVQVGQTLTLKINGLYNVQVMVVGLVQGVLTGPLGYVNRAGYNRMAQLANKSNFLAIRTDTTDPQLNANTIKLLEARFKRASLGVTNTSLTSDTRNTLNSQFDIVIYLLLSMALLLAFVGGLGLAGTMSINVIERTREIGVMRAIGASDGAVQRIVISEGLVIGLLSWLLGIGVAVPFGYFIKDLLGSALQFDVLYAFSWVGLITWLALVVTIAALASAVPAWRASRLTVQEILVYQ